MFEEEILQKTTGENQTPIKKSDNSLLLPKEFLAPELTDTQAWINSEPLSLAQLKGKVVIVDFWTYSCINCVRTLPYLNAWHEMYKDDGLVILGVHTYEFAFEKELANVQKAVADFGIKYPVVQDNNRSTWNAYKNRYWPAKYIVDKEGYIRYTHFGEGEYEETEEVIRALLAEGETKQITSGMVKVEPIKVDYQKIGTPETYLGYGRAEHNGNVEKLLPNQTITFSSPNKSIEGEYFSNLFYLIGDWYIAEDYVVPKKLPAQLIMSYKASKVNLVVEKDDASTQPATAKILLDGKPIPADKRGTDVREDGTVIFDKDTLYNLVDTGDQYESHTLTIEFQTLNVKPYVFTFG